jgi:hypothetical protein
MEVVKEGKQTFERRGSVTERVMKRVRDEEEGGEEERARMRGGRKHVERGSVRV